MPRPRYKKSVLRKNWRASVSYTPVSSPCSTISILCGMRVNSWSRCLAASPVILPRTCPRCAASRSNAVSCAVIAFVEATPISGPACVKIDPAASRVTIEPITLQIASVGEPFSLASRCPARVSACSTGYDAHLLEFAELLLGNLHLVQEDLSGVLRDPAEEGVAHGARLLENLFLHEVLVAALFGHDGVPGNVLRRSLDWPSVVVHHGDALLREHGDVAVGKEKDFSRVLQERGNIAGYEKFAIAESDHRGRSHARRHDLVRVFRGHEHQGVDAAQLFQRAAHGFLKRRDRKSV